MYHYFYFTPEKPRLGKVTELGNCRTNIQIRQLETRVCIWTGLYGFPSRSTVSLQSQLDSRFKEQELCRLACPSFLWTSHPHSSLCCPEVQWEAVSCKHCSDGLQPSLVGRLGSCSIHPCTAVSGPLVFRIPPEDVSAVSSFSFY